MSRASKKSTFNPTPDLAANIADLERRRACADLGPRKGDELFYRSLDAGRMMVVPVSRPSRSFGPERLRSLFDRSQYLRGSAPGNDARVRHVAPDGQRFLMIKARRGETRDDRVSLPQHHSSSRTGSRN